MPEIGRAMAEGAARALFLLLDLIAGLAASASGGHF
jgi:hypothetical protein